MMIEGTAPLTACIHTKTARAIRAHLADSRRFPNRVPAPIRRSRTRIPKILRSLSPLSLGFDPLRLVGFSPLSKSPEEAAPIELPTLPEETPDSPRVAVSEALPEAVAA